MLILIHEISDGKICLFDGSQILDKTDTKGVALAAQFKDVITMGTTIYEPAPKALELFRENNGKRWKAILANAWKSGNYPLGTAGVDTLNRLGNKNVIL